MIIPQGLGNWFHGSMVRSGSLRLHVVPNGPRNVEDPQPCHQKAAWGHHKQSGGSF